MQLSWEVIYMREVQEETVDMTNEEYREELIKIFHGINENKILRFWYKYIGCIEKGRD